MEGAGRRQISPWLWRGGVAVALLVAPLLLMVLAWSAPDPPGRGFVDYSYAIICYILAVASYSILVVEKLDRYAGLRIVAATAVLAILVTAIATFAELLAVSSCIDAHGQCAWTPATDVVWLTIGILAVLGAGAAHSALLKSGVSRLLEVLAHLFSVVVALRMAGVLLDDDAGSTFGAWPLLLILLPFALILMWWAMPPSRARLIALTAWVLLPVYLLIAVVDARLGPWALAWPVSVVAGLGPSGSVRQTSIACTTRAAGSRSGWANTGTGSRRNGATMFRPIEADIPDRAGFLTVFIPRRLLGVPPDADGSAEIPIDVGIERHVLGQFAFEDLSVMVFYSPEFGGPTYDEVVGRVRAYVVASRIPDTEADALTRSWEGAR